MERASSSGKRSRTQASATVTSEQQAMVSQAGTSSMQRQQLATQTQQQLQPPSPGYDMTSASDSDSDSGPLRVPLKLVVADAVKRWFSETQTEARRGDVKQQALLAQMLAEGYGCKQDPEEARRWAERARVRGYQMSGVYCEL